MIIPSVAMRDVNVIKLKTINVLQDLRRKLKSRLEDDDYLDDTTFNSAAIFFV